MTERRFGLGAGLRVFADGGDGPVGGALALPPELAFLAGHGVAPSDLHAVADSAARNGVDPTRHAVATGVVDETSCYRAFAAALGLRFAAIPPPILPGGDASALLRTGIARADPAATGQSFVVAPEGPALRRMLDGLSGHPRADILVTTPSAFAAGVRRANGKALAAAIAGVDRQGIGRRTARTGSTWGQVALYVIVSWTVIFLGVLHPATTALALSLVLLPLFLATVALRISGLFEPAPVDLWREHGWRIDDARLPVYTVAVPLLRETRVLPKLVAALSALDYPPAKLDIRLLVEAHDAELIAAIEAADLPPTIRMAIVPPGMPRTKPRALNLALLEARGTLITVFDAEDVPDPRQLRTAAEMFLKSGPELACVQARLVIDNSGDGILPSLFALEYAGLFDVVNPALLKARLPIMLGGTSNHFRTEALREIGGWDAWNVTEDADVGLRLARAGRRFADLPLRTLEEAPRTPRIWLNQRTRWMKGYLQTIITHLAAPRSLLREAGVGQAAVFVTLALGSLLSALGYPFFVTALALALLDGELMARDDLAGRTIATLALSVPLAGAAAIIGPALCGAWRRRAFRLLLWLPLMPLYYLLVSLAAWLALVEYARDRHRWNKTPHGLARTSSYAPPAGSNA